jgi:hypothetical protein
MSRSSPSTPCVPDFFGVGKSSRRQTGQLNSISSRWRGCFGVALVATHPYSGVCRFGRLFVPDRDVRWVTVFDLPYGAPRIGVPHRSRWAAVYRTRIRYGMPTLGGEPELAFAFRGNLMHVGRTGKRLRRRIPQGWRHMLSVVAAIDRAMTQSAADGNAGASSNRERLDRVDNRQFVQRLRHPHACLPRPFLAFDEGHRGQLFPLATPSSSNGEVYFPPGLRRRLCMDVSRGLPVPAPFAGTLIGATTDRYHGDPVITLAFAAGDRSISIRVSRRAHVQVPNGATVREGDVIASDLITGLPHGWHRLPTAVQSHLILSGSGSRAELDHFTRLWFERQFLAIRPGILHVPAEIAAAAASGRAVDSELYWDLGQCMECYREIPDAFVFPPIRMPAWWKFRGVLPGEIACDFSPRNLRCAGRQDGHDRL